MDDLIDQIIAHGFLAQRVYSKVSFDNAKDTGELLAVTKENADMVQVAIKARIIPYVDELLEKKLRSVIDGSDGRIALRLGNGRFTIVEVKDIERQIDKLKKETEQ